MRRYLLPLFGIALMASVPAVKAYAQSQADDDARRRAESDADKKKKAKEKEWTTGQAPLPDVKNAGPCPYVKVLYDAARYIELKDGKETSGAVGWTGEIQNVRSACQYKGSDPIHVQTSIAFSLGRGPEASGQSKDYRYWVAVTTRNSAVVAKQYFDIVGEFQPGQDRINVVDRLQDIVIPRANTGVSGSNFEVLIGFDVTPEMADFNRLGKRFRVSTPAVAQIDAHAPGEK